MKKIFFSLLLALTTSLGFPQTNYSLKLETGYSLYQFKTIDIDPGPNWKGYNLNEQNGFDINITNGLKFNEKIFSGIGFGYLNFEGINGFSIFADFDYSILKTRFTPFINLKAGYNHIWNQYENGRGSGLGELNIGLKYKLTENLDIYIQSGFLMTQQSLLLPMRLGVKL